MRHLPLPWFPPEFPICLWSGAARECASRRPGPRCRDGEGGRKREREGLAGGRHMAPVTRLGLHGRGSSRFHGHARPCSDASMPRAYLYLPARSPEQGRERTRAESGCREEYKSRQLATTTWMQHYSTTPSRPLDGSRPLVTEPGPWTVLAKTYQPHHLPGRLTPLRPPGGASSPHESRPPHYLVCDPRHAIPSNTH